VSDKLVARIELSLQELSRATQQLDPLIQKGSNADLDVIETSAVAAMLHSFYTLIEKILESLAREMDGAVSRSDQWHRDLIGQMAAPTAFRQAVISEELADKLKEYLAFRHLFRGASIVLMRWNKMQPLANRAGETFRQFESELSAFLAARGASLD
jgi:hypothetical protein